MMTVPMENSSSPITKERVHCLLNKNIELDNGLKMATKAKVPSDPNAWLQMRENYEAIILEDHDFSESLEIEFSLWKLHYKRIEEFRGHINSATAPAGSIASRGGNGFLPDRIKKIRAVFKGFLSESTGFYHDLILKIRAKYGLPLGCFSEGPENQITSAKDGKKSAEIKKGLVSCHRCLTYLGDLARYKALYGDGDSATRDYAVASSYYLQAASLWPLSGNPHHQLAILASYSGDEFVAVYRYFRSLAVDNPFLTARDNLIIVFEKNRQTYSQLPGDVKISSAKTIRGRMNGRGRGKGESKLLSRESTPVKERVASISEVYKAFCIRFVRLHGILFTRTSMETFGGVFSLVLGDLNDLLSSGREQELNFGSDLVENGLFVVRLVSILIFTVHNVNKELEVQSYAEILQRSVLLQNAFTAAFEIMGHIVKRCIQLEEMLSSYLLPSILVFIEWLACHLDIATASDVDDKQASARSFFWSQCLSLFNKLLRTGVVSMCDDEDDACFSDMYKYDEEETGNHLALWEDFELRGFLPLTPAHLILDFSRQHSIGTDGGGKEKRARAQRLLAAGKTLLNVIQVDQQGVYYDRKLNEFATGTQPKCSQDAADLPLSNGVTNGDLIERTQNAECMQSAPHSYIEGEEEDEVIVFKPSTVEKHAVVSTPQSTSAEVSESIESAAKGDWPTYSEAFRAIDNSKLPSANLHQSMHLSSARLPHPNMDSNNGNLMMEGQFLLTNGLRDLSIDGNGVLNKTGLQEGLCVPHSLAFSLPSSSSINHDPHRLPSVPRVLDSVIPSKHDTIMPCGTAANVQSIKPPQVSAVSKKNPVSRPLRHFGPPPGFNPVPSKQSDSSIMGLSLKKEYSLLDGYSWLDEYQSPLNESMENNSLNSWNGKSHVFGNGNSSSGMINFPFPGRVPNVDAEVENQERLLDYQLLEHLKYPKELQYNQVKKGVQQPGSFSDKYEGQSIWSGGFFV